MATTRRLIEVARRGRPTRHILVEARSDRPFGSEVDDASFTIDVEELRSFTGAAHLGLTEEITVGIEHEPDNFETRRHR
jgi:hypothetical protein